MKRTFLTYGSLTVLAAVVTGAIAMTQTSSLAQRVQLPTQASHPMMSSSMAAAMTARSGQFQAAEHPTQGMAKLVTEKGKTYLEFDRTFKTDSGPDLYVIFYRGSQPPVSGIKAADYVSIGRLQKVSGSQRYQIPQGVNPAQFQSVAVWCRQFNATFGYAPLSQ